MKGWLISHVLISETVIVLGLVSRFFFGSNISKCEYSGSKLGKGGKLSDLLVTLNRFKCEVSEWSMR